MKIFCWKQSFIWPFTKHQIMKIWCPIFSQPFLHNFSIPLIFALLSFYSWLWNRSSHPGFPAETLVFSGTEVAVETSLGKSLQWWSLQIFFEISTEGRDESVGSRALRMRFSHSSGCQGLSILSSVVEFVYSNLIILTFFIRLSEMRIPKIPKTFKFE